MNFFCSNLAAMLLTMVFFGMGGWRFMADSWRMGLQKLITVLDIFHTYKGGVRVGFINTNDMHKNDVGKGRV
jgi:hypothetical protein